MPLEGCGTTSWVPVKSGGTSVGLSNVGVEAIAVARKRLLPDERAGLREQARAAEFFETRHSYQRSERQPVPGNTVGRHGTRFDGAEGRRAETCQRLHHAESCVGVFEHQAAVGQGKSCVKAAVDGGDLNLFVRAGNSPALWT